MTTPPEGPLGLRLSSLVRAGGTAATLLAGNPAGLLRTTLLAGGSNVVAREIDPAGIQVLSISPDADINVGGEGGSRGGQADLITTASSTASWIAANLLLAKLASLLPLPRIVKAAVFGAGVYALDDMVVKKVTAVREHKPAEESAKAA
ncbi:MAG TPA: hypothetical protein VH419_00185 [Nocardioidaceae bacterium]|jgi:hypothetical protein